MSDSIRNDLLGYLLDALEPDEMERVAQALRRDPALQEELRLLRGGLSLLREEDADIQPPPGLARRTCDLIARHERATEESPPAELAAPRRELSSWEPPSSAGRWRPVDVAVALAVCLAGVAMIFPIINLSRARSRVTVCSNKLREIGVALTEYSEHQNGYFPRVEESGPMAAGGIYAPQLFSGGYVTDPREFLCPGTPLAGESSFHIPTLAELNAAHDRSTEDALRRMMGGSYGYTLGYRENGVYKPTLNRHRETFALASDVPADDCSCSPNHGEMGQNVLLEDGHVVHLSHNSTTVEGSADDIFRNDDGKVAAGCQMNDAVVVPSYGMP